MAKVATHQRAAKRKFELLLRDLRPAIQGFYGRSLVALVVFGSVGRGTPHSDSDVDLLIVADPLPSGRMRRMDEFAAVKKALANRIKLLEECGIFTRLSPVFKTPAEVRRGSLLFLDMIDDGLILTDPSDFRRRYLREFRRRLDRLGARKIYEGDRWYWDLKPDYKPGEVFEI
jgi:uncharacterized protein